MLIRLVGVSVLQVGRYLWGFYVEAKFDLSEVLAWPWKRFAGPKFVWVDFVRR